MQVLKSEVVRFTARFLSFWRFTVTIAVFSAFLPAISLGFYPLTIHDHIMSKQIFRYVETEDWLTCLQECNWDIDCSSYNFKYDSYKTGTYCELSKCAMEEGTSVNANDLLFKQGFVFQQLKPTKNKSLCIGRTEKIIKATPLAYGGLEDSKILSNSGNSRHLRDLSSFLNAGMTTSRTWRRCYHAGKEGLNASQFHFNCDSKGPTVTIVRVAKYIFGGYIDNSWKSYTNDYTGWLHSTEAFLFSLYNVKGYEPHRMNITLEGREFAAYDEISNGPSFGKGYDFRVGHNTKPSYARCDSYETPPSCTIGKMCSFYTGKYYFTTDEVEVFFEAK